MWKWRQELAVFLMASLVVILRSSRSTHEWCTAPLLFQNHYILEEGKRVQLNLYKNICSRPVSGIPCCHLEEVEKYRKIKDFSSVCVYMIVFMFKSTYNHLSYLLFAKLYCYIQIIYIISIYIDRCILNDPQIFKLSYLLIPALCL